MKELNSARELFKDAQKEGGNQYLVSFYRETYIPDNNPTTEEALVLIKAALKTIHAQKYLFTSDSNSCYLVHYDYSYVLRLNLRFSAPQGGWMLSTWRREICTKCRTFPHMDTCSEKSS